jgi:hypothetical protein
VGNHPRLWLGFAVKASRFRMTIEVSLPPFLRFPDVAAGGNKKVAAWTFFEQTLVFQLPSLSEFRSHPDILSTWLDSIEPEMVPNHQTTLQPCQISPLPSLRLHLLLRDELRMLVLHRAMDITMAVVLTKAVERPIEGTVEAAVEEDSRTVGKTPNGKVRTHRQDHT